VKYSKTCVTSARGGVAERGQLGVEPLLTRDRDEGNPALAAFAREPLEPLREVRPAAQHAHNDRAGRGNLFENESVESLAGLEVVDVAGANGGKVGRKPADGRGRVPVARYQRSSGSRTSASPHLRRQVTCTADDRRVCHDQPGMASMARTILVRNPKGGGVPKGWGGRRASAISPDRLTLEGV